MMRWRKHGIAAGDYDNDGAPDLFVAGFRQAWLFRNRGDGTFEDVTARSGLRLSGLPLRTGLWVDLDNDGWLDLVVTAHILGPDMRLPSGQALRAVIVYHNEGNGTFRDLTVRWIPGNPLGPAGALCAADFNRDGWLDLFVAYDNTYIEERSPNEDLAAIRRERAFWHPSMLYLNDGGKAFRVPEGWGTEHHNSRSTMRAAAFCDYNQDGWPDLTIACDEDQSSILWENRAGQGDPRIFSENLSEKLGLTGHERGKSVAWGDMDGDGWEDLFVSHISSTAGTRFFSSYGSIRDNPSHRVQQHLKHTQGSLLYRNVQGKAFEEASAERGVRKGGWLWGAEFFDYDNDGDLDLYAANGEFTGPRKGDC